MIKRFTSQAVRLGHPDIIADTISDAVVTDILSRDKNGRIACQVMATKNMVVISGQITTNTYCDFNQIVHDTIETIGYHSSQQGISPNCGVIQTISPQSPDIANGIHNGDDLGAGDQGFQIGYATNETDVMLPLPIYASHKILQLVEQFSRDNPGILRPDGKSQVLVSYDKNGKPTSIDKILLSLQHDPQVTNQQLNDYINYNVYGKFYELFPEYVNTHTKLIVNPSGRFVIGGPMGDTGMTSRKLAVTTYGGMARIGGGGLCVDARTQFLSQDGWKRMDEFQDGDKVGQYNNGKLEYVTPNRYIAQPCERMNEIVGDTNISQALTDDHRFIYLTSKNNIAEKRVKDLIQMHNSSKLGFSGAIIPFFDYSGYGIDLTDDEIRLQIAFMADGTLSGRNRVRVLGERKVQRLIQLLNLTGRPHQIKHYSDEYTYFYFTPPIETKVFDFSFWSNASRKQLEIIAQQVVKWDGDNDSKFRTTIKQNADFIQYVFTVVSQKNCHITSCNRIGQSYGNGYTRKSIQYIVSMGKTKYCAMKRKSTDPKLRINTIQPENKMMYCFSVDSGMLILRRDDRIFISGNCGKDPSKVDRSGAYYTRYVAKSIVSAGLCDKLQIHVSYAIGMKQPFSIGVQVINTNTHNKISSDAILQIIKYNFNFQPQNMIKELGLLDVDYRKTTISHFMNQTFPWEKIKELR